MDESTLPTGTHIRSGLESQRLRSYCSTVVWGADDLDDFARTLQSCDLAAVRTSFQGRVEKEGIEAVRKSLASVRYGRGKIPIFNYILQLAYTDPRRHTYYIEATRFLALDAKVPVDSTDLSGTTAFMYAISTKPYLDIEFADIMLEAGANVNARNRYGCNAGHDPVMIGNPNAKEAAMTALKYFISKGGDIDVTDGDGYSVRRVGSAMTKIFPELAEYLKYAGDTTSKPMGKKIGRNDPCSCGSKKKYKTCCGKN